MLYHPNPPLWPWVQGHELWNFKLLKLPGRCAPVEFFSWKCGKLRKTAKSGYPALIWPFRTSLFSALSWNKISHMKQQSLTIFKTVKDIFYKQFEFFANWQGGLWGLVNLVLCMFLNSFSISIYLQKIIRNLNTKIINTVPVFHIAGPTQLFVHRGANRELWTIQTVL